MHGNHYTYIADPQTTQERSAEIPGVDIVELDNGGQSSQINTNYAVGHKKEPTYFCLLASFLWLTVYVKRFYISDIQLSSCCFS